MILHLGEDIAENDDIDYSDDYEESDEDQDQYEDEEDTDFMPEKEYKNIVRDVVIFFFSYYMNRCLGKVNLFFLFVMGL